MLQWVYKRDREKKKKKMAPLQRASPHPQAIRTDQTIIQHFTHPKHPLQRVHIQAEYSCDGCNTWGGAGFRYRCSAGCDFDLHGQCATCPLSLSSHLHPNHQLVLVNQPGNGNYCNSCRQLVNGLFYICRPCDVDLHPICCTKTPLPPQPQLQVHHPTGGPVLAVHHPTMNRAVLQAPPTPSPHLYNNNSLNSPGFGVNQGFVQPGGVAQGIGYPQNIQPYNLPSNNNNNGLVAANGSNRQTNNNKNNRIGTFVRKAVTTSIFGFPI